MRHGEKSVTIDCPPELGWKTFYGKLREAGISFSAAAVGEKLTVTVGERNESQTHSIMCDCLSGKYVNVQKFEQWKNNYKFKTLRK